MDMIPVTTFLSGGDAGNGDFFSVVSSDFPD